MMIERRQRELKQLYDSTNQISEPKITPILEGLYRIQGPIDESENPLNNQRFKEKENSSERKNPKSSKGECDHCSAPCVSCSHFSNRTQFEMKSKRKTNKVVKEEEDNSPPVSGTGQDSTSPKTEKIEEKETVETVVKSATSKLEETKPETDNENEKGEKSNSCDLNTKEKSTETSDNNEDEIEDDVKVCDICGDVGQEDLLAFCTRCSDGAEHTYCMRVQMKKLPVGKWFCEECEIEVENEKLLRKKGKQKAANKSTDKHEEYINYLLEDGDEDLLEIELLKKDSKNKAPRSLNAYAKKRDQEESSKKVDSADPKNLKSEIPKKNESGNPKPESEIPKKVESGNLKLESASTKKEETVDNKKETESGDKKKVESIDLKKKGPVNNLDLEKGKPGTSVSKPPVPVHPLRGNLSKSTSFKSSLSKEPKVKQINEVPQNSKIVKEPISNNNLKKEGPDQKIAKSTSFKKPPMKPSLKLPISEDSRLIKDPKERINVDNNNNNNNNTNNNINNNKSGSILGRPNPLGGILSTPKLDSTNQGQDNSSSQGRNEMKKPLLPKPDDISTCPLLDSILQRSTMPMPSRAPRCQRCNETGHSIQFCPKDPTRFSAVNNKQTHNLSERNNVHNSVKEGVLTRPKLIEAENTICSSPSVVFEHVISTIIPEMESIWQGGFELVKDGKSTDIFEGFQAHFSSSVSPKLQKIVKRLPLQVQLEEVPRQQMWPPQFLQDGPTESHIALYFFAKDRQSYESCYVKLVESMSKNDVALRGSIDSIELLVYPSTLLPEYSQRWNRLFYLWGVFKGKSVNLSKEAEEADSKGENVNLRNDKEILEREKGKQKEEIIGPCENEIMMDTNKKRRAESMEPISDLNIAQGHKKTKVDNNGDLHSVSESVQGITDEKSVCCLDLNLEIGNSGGIPNLELGLGDEMNISPKKELVPGENSGNDHVPVPVRDDGLATSLSSLSLSLAFGDSSKA